MPGKVCKNCGENVDDFVKFCPNCGSSTFINTNTNTAVTNRQSSLPNKKKTQSNDFVHKLFYWKYDGGYIFSKTKTISILTFVAFALSIDGIASYAMIIIGLFFAVIFYVMGFAIHKILGRDRPSRNVLENNDFGFLKDLKNAFLCWQNKNTGEFVFSKTKIITILIFLFFTGICIKTAPSLFACLAVGFIFAAPSCIIGYSLHKLTNNNPTPKKVTQKPKPQTIPEVKHEEPEIQAAPEIVEEMFESKGYQSKLNDLRKDYEVKENHLRSLIEKRFEPPQLTYNKFMASVDNCTDMFNSQADSIQSIIDLASEDSKRVDDEIKSKFEILESLIEKIEDLTNELVLNMGKSNDLDVKDLLDDMDDLIDSVNNYD